MKQRKPATQACREEDMMRSLQIIILSRLCIGGKEEKVMERFIVCIQKITVFPIVLLLLQFSMPQLSNAAWTSSGPAGGDVTCMTRSPSNSACIYAGTRSGVWKSVDSGETWARTNFPDTEVLSIQVEPDNENILYAGTSHSYEFGGIFKSVNGGISWSLKGIAGQDVNAIAIDPNNTNIIFAGTGSWESSWPEEIIGIFKSTNGGESWGLMISFGGEGEPIMRKITAIVVDPDDSLSIYAGGHNYGIPVFAAFLESTDGGETWTDKAFKGLWQSIGSLAITPKGYNPKTLFATVGDDPSPGQFGYFCTSTDKGETWNSWSANFTKAITVNPVYSDLVYVGSGSSGVPFLIFNHRTELWIPFFSVGLPVTSPTSIVMNPSEESYFCAGFISAGIYKVRSTGDWYLTPLNATNILDVAVRPGSSNTVVAAIEGNYHLAVSTNAGNSWGEFVNSPTNRAAIAYDPQNPDYLYAGFGWQYRTNTAYQLNISTDGGLGWTLSGLMFYNPGSVTVGVTDIWVNPNDAQKILVTVGSPYGGIYISSNGGSTWSSFLSDTFWASAVAADPNNSDRLFYGTYHYGYVMLSLNGGTIWDDISPGVDTFWEVRDIVVDLNSKTYAATDVGLWTWDGGAWAKISGLPTDNITALTIDRSSNPEIFYAGTGDGGVLVSGDGGTSWQGFNEGLSVLHITKLAISDEVPKILYAGTAYGGVWRRALDACQCDFDGDSDVDGSDLAEYIRDDRGLGLNSFAMDFGKNHCAQD